jgi:hypothetical protein
LPEINNVPSVFAKPGAPFAQLAETNKHARLLDIAIIQTVSQVQRALQCQNRKHARLLDVEPRIQTVLCQIKPLFQRGTNSVFCFGSLQ